MIHIRPLRFLAAPLLLLAVAACDNAEERAEHHYERGLLLLEEGAPEKAKLEFKNALQLDEDAIAPRVAFARVLMDEGDVQGALGHYYKIIDLNPDHPEARKVVGRITILAGEPEEAVEHVDAVFALMPDDIEVRELKALLDHRLDRAVSATAMAESVLADDPGNIVATLILSEQAQAQDDMTKALKILDTGLAVKPDARDLHLAKLRALEGLDDQAAIGAQLITMSELFFDDAAVAQGLVQWHLNQSDPDSAIAAQRALTQKFPDDPGHGLDLIRLLNNYRGAEAAREELAKLASNPVHQVIYTQAQADFELHEGNLGAGIDHLETLVERDDLEPRQSQDVRAQLAGLHYRNGDRARAAELISAVLTENGDHVPALKQRAVEAIDADRPEDAIIDLRHALNVIPQEPSVLMLLATAHERNGSSGLAQERLALAVQASQAGVAESLAYADFLSRQDKADIAEDVLRDAISRRGEVVDLLLGLGRIQLARSDWDGVTETADRLEALGDVKELAEAAGQLRLAALNSQDKFDDSIGLLREMWQASGERSSAMENLVHSYVQSGRTAEAAEFLDDILKDDPKNLRATLLRGALHAFVGEADLAEAKYREVIADHPKRANGYGVLASLLRSQGRVAEADEVMAQGIANAENIERLLFEQATQNEAAGDFEGAIAIYEQLYAANNVSDVLANNLASLLSEHRDDPESLERAHTIAKRLSSSPEGAFQDTYGWILYRRGEYERALPALQIASDAYPDNPVVLFHLGMVLEKLGQTTQAVETLTRALEQGANLNLPQMDEARKTLDALQAQ